MTFFDIEFETKGIEALLEYFISLLYFIILLHFKKHNQTIVYQ